MESESSFTILSHQYEESCDRFAYTECCYFQFLSCMPSIWEVDCVICHNSFIVDEFWPTFCSACVCISPAIDSNEVAFSRYKRLRFLNFSSHFQSFKFLGNLKQGVGELFAKKSKAKACAGHCGCRQRRRRRVSPRLAAAAAQAQRAGHPAANLPAPRRRLVPTRSVPPCSGSPARPVCSSHSNFSHRRPQCSNKKPPPQAQH